MPQSPQVGIRPRDLVGYAGSRGRLEMKTAAAARPVEYLVPGFLVHTKPGRQRFIADIIGAQSPRAERVGKALADAARGTPQHEG